MLKKTITLFLGMIFIFGIFQSKAYANSKIENISITFGKASSERNFNWTTKTKPAKIPMLYVWDDAGYDKKYLPETETVNAFKDYSSNSNIFYGAANKTTFIRYKATVKDLEEGKTYFYKITDGVTESGIHSFTIEDAKDGFSFIYMTDSQAATANDFSVFKRTAETAVTKFPKSAFAVIAGDLVDIGGSERLWDNFFGYGSGLTSNYTLAPVIGNHETDFTPHTYDKHFNFPKNENDLPDYVTSFDYGDARFYLLTTEMTYREIFLADDATKAKAEALINNQIEWLKRTCRENPKKWNIVVLHKGFYPSGGYYNDGTVLELRKRFVPVFDELGIDAVLGGHDHTFSKAFKYNFQNVQGASEKNALITKDENTKGTLYLINNSAGTKFYQVKSEPRKDFLCYQPHRQMFTSVSVKNKSLKFDTYAVNSEGNVLMDYIEIVK